MKKKIFSLVFVCIVFVAACNSKTEKTSESEAVENDFLKSKIGMVENGTFKIADSITLKSGWEKHLRAKGKDVALENFRIVEGMTSGDFAEPYHMLVAASTDGKIKTASLLILKNNDFYFDAREDENGHLSYLNIVCEGSCEDGCSPTATISGGNKYLNCSPCPDCKKESSEFR